MRLHKRVLFLVVCLLAAALTAPAFGAQSSNSREPEILLRAIEVPAGFRYTASLLKPSDMPIDALYAEIVLAERVEITSVAETGALSFGGLNVGDDQTKLVWSADDIDGETLTPLTFIVPEPLEEDFEVYIEWVGGSSGGSTSINGKPDAQATSPGESLLELGVEGTGAGMVQVGQTGVFVGVAPNLVPDGTQVSVRQLSQEQNPPAEVTAEDGALLWWCSLVEIMDLPENAAVSVTVPLRQPLPPFTPVNLYALQDDGTWALLAEQGIVSADGQTLSYIHSGGIIAAGVNASFQPRPADLTLSIPETLERGALLASVMPEANEPMSLPEIPLCADVEDATTLCSLFGGVYRQCLPDYLSCTFYSTDFGTCFDAGILGLEDGTGLMCTGVSEPAETL